MLKKSLKETLDEQQLIMKTEVLCAINKFARATGFRVIELRPVQETDPLGTPPKYVGKIYADALDVKLK